MVHDGSKEKFSSKIGYIVALAGSAVGLGNLWRFPYLADKYGGGGFIVIYLILALTFGFAMMITETTLGRRSGRSGMEVFGALSEKHRWIGYLVALVPMIILPYYCVIGGWVLRYLYGTVTGELETFTNDGFFSNFITYGSSDIMSTPTIWFIIFSAVLFVLAAMGVNKGIEKLSKVLLPALLIMVIAIVIYVMTLDGAIDGVREYLVPKSGSITLSTVVAACGQLFFSVSLAMGITITYGSYMKKDVDIEKSTHTIEYIDTTVAILAGLMVVPLVYIFSSSDISSGPGLMFQTLPLAFNSMPGGFVIACAFFLLVAFAAFTSAISIAETVIHCFRDKFGITRPAAIVICAILVAGLGSLSCFGYGPLSGFCFNDMYFLDMFDFFVNNLLMPTVAILTCLFIGYVVKPSYIIEEVESSGEFRAKRWYPAMIKYICPVLLITILITGVLQFFGIYSI